MPECETESSKHICLDGCEEIIISTAKKPSKIKCEVCGAENDPGRELCRVCSNYLENNKEG